MAESPGHRLRAARSRFLATARRDNCVAANDAERLTRLLTYHVVPGRFVPTTIDGTHQTLQGGELSVAGPQITFG